MAGCAIDGQNVQLNVDSHLSEIFLKDFHLTWDPAHRIELAIDDITKHNEHSNFIEHTTSVIQNLMKHGSYGQAYLELLGNKDLSESFLTPKVFKSMKFVGHCS